MTEDEARKRWCPHARAASVRDNSRDNIVTVNRYGNESDPDCLCLASECMSWRWRVYPGECAGDEEPRGYCGLAGRPE